jgi:UPF0716 protein FxsA
MPILTMFRLLFLLFLIIPAIEIALFIQIGGVIGVIPTLFLILITAIVGVALLRLQGLITLVRVQESMNRGEIPAVELLEGLMLLLSGAFLLTPGFFTDAVGFAVLMPAVRRSVAIWLLSHLNIMTFGGGRRPPGGPDVHTDSQGHRTIEGEFQRKD